MRDMHAGAASIAEFTVMNAADVRAMHADSI
jgi:hypothetical protein